MDIIKKIRNPSTIHSDLLGYLSFLSGVFEEKIIGLNHIPFDIKVASTNNIKRSVYFKIKGAILRKIHISFYLPGERLVSAHHVSYCDHVDTNTNALIDEKKVWPFSSRLMRVQMVLRQFKCKDYFYLKSLFLSIFNFASIVHFKAWSQDVKFGSSYNIKVINQLLKNIKNLVLINIKKQVQIIKKVPSMRCYA